MGLCNKKICFFPFYSLALSRINTHTHAHSLTHLHTLDPTVLLLHSQFHHRSILSWHCSPIRLPLRFDFMMSFFFSLFVKWIACKRPNYVKPTMEIVRLFIRLACSCSLPFSLNTTLQDEDKIKRRRREKKQWTRLQIKSDTGKIKMEINGFFMKLCHPLKNERKTHIYTCSVCVCVQHIQQTGKAHKRAKRIKSNQPN